MKVVPVILLILFHFTLITGQDLQIYGVINTYKFPINQQEINIITSKCYAGIGFTTCIPELPSDEYALDENLPYLNNLEVIKGSNFCLQCCGSSPFKIDYWNLNCPTDRTSIGIYNQLGAELRLATNRFSGDLGYITCPIRRSACTYDEKGNTLSCNSALSNNYLVGMVATINVIEYDSYFAYRRGVLSCSVVSYESNTSLKLGQSFHEEYILNYEPQSDNSLTDYSKLIFLLFILLIFIYGFLYWYRKKHCEYCQKKLIISTKLCYVCQGLGVQPPDPVIMKALEEKGLQLQGDIRNETMFGRCILRIVRTVSVCFCWKRHRMVNPTAIHISQLTESSDMNQSSFSQINNDQDESKQEPPQDESDQVIKPKKWRKKKKNPNLLPYPQEIIYGAVAPEIVKK